MACGKDGEMQILSAAMGNDSLRSPAVFRYRLRRRLALPVARRPLLGSLRCSIHIQERGLEQSGQQTLTMFSVGKTVEGSEQGRWIEFKIQANENGTERLWIRKLLIPERYLKKGENPTLHVIRGWTQQEDGKVERAVPVHGRWPAFLAGPLQDETKLAKQLVESRLGPLMCEGVAGWIEFAEGNLNTKVTFETRLNERHRSVLCSHGCCSKYEVTAPTTPLIRRRN
jgi:hypothetical protein